MRESKKVLTDALPMLLEELLQEFIEQNKKTPSSFSFFMTKVCDHLYTITSHGMKEVVVSPVDCRRLLEDIYKYRNQVTSYGSKISQYTPFYMVEFVSEILKWDDDKHVSALAYMAYLCCKLSIRHDKRTNFGKASMYAHDSITCSKVIRLYLPGYVDPKTRSLIGKEAVKSKLLRDPKQQDKLFVLECWQKWQSDPTTYKGKASFARDMLTKCEHLTSQKKIEDWCRDWESKSGTQPVE